MIQVNYNGDMISQFYLELNFEKHGCRREIHGCRAIITLNFLGFQISLLPKDKQVKLFHKKKKKKVNNLLFSLPFTLLLSVFLFIFSIKAIFQLDKKKEKKRKMDLYKI